MQFIEKPYLKKRRQRLLSGLTGTVLEIGVGTGVNFEFYTPSVKLTGIEPSHDMLEFAKEKRKSSLAKDQIELLEIGWEDPVLTELFPPESLDNIVCTLVLCTIPNPEKAISQFQAWLKPGGNLLILEHIRSSGRLGFFFQEKINPIWNKVAGGCHLTRSTDQMIECAGFELIEKTYFKVGLTFVEGIYQRKTTHRSV